MAAVTANQLEAVQLLRKNGADYYIYDNGGCTAVHWAVDAKNVKMLDWMATDGVDFNIKDKGPGGWTPLIRCG
jgi:ankyrin repeat protein